MVINFGKKIIYFLKQNFLSNRFIMFNNYCIPKESLLGKTGDINENGQYTSPFKDKSKRLGNILQLLLYIIHNYIIKISKPLWKIHII